MAWLKFVELQGSHNMGIIVGTIRLVFIIEVSVVKIVVATILGIRIVLAISRVIIIVTEIVIVMVIKPTITTVIVTGMESMCKQQQ